MDSQLFRRLKGVIDSSIQIDVQKFSITISDQNQIELQNWFYMVNFTITELL